MYKLINNKDTNVMLWYVDKKRGQRTEPWGTPVARCCDLDTSPIQDILKDLSER